MSNQKRVIRKIEMLNEPAHTERVVGKMGTIVRSYLYLTAESYCGYAYTADLAKASSMSGREFDKYYRLANLEYESDKNVVIDHLNND